MDYAFICLVLVGFAIFMYVVLDGFDLGVGILFPYFTEDQQEVALKTIAPLWDGNETWLILGGAVLFAAFPHAYSTLLPAFYLPLMLMLCSLVVRGVAFEFRAKRKKARRFGLERFFFLRLLLRLHRELFWALIYKSATSQLTCMKKLLFYGKAHLFFYVVWGCALAMHYSAPVGWWRKRIRVCEIRPGIYL